MIDKLICPECGSDDISFLAINEFNSYMYGCQDCYHLWGDVAEPSPIPAPNEAADENPRT